MKLLNSTFSIYDNTLIKWNYSIKVNIDFTPIWTSFPGPGRAGVLDKTVEDDRNSKISDIRDWCYENFGLKNFTITWRGCKSCTNHYQPLTFEFTKLEDATLFELAWG